MSRSGWPHRATPSQQSTWLCTGSGTTLPSSLPVFHTGECHGNHLNSPRIGSRVTSGQDGNSHSSGDCAGAATHIGVTRAWLFTAGMRVSSTSTGAATINGRAGVPWLLPDTSYPYVLPRSTLYLRVIREAFNTNDSLAVSGRNPEHIATGASYFSS